MLAWSYFALSLSEVVLPTDQAVNDGGRNLQVER